MKVIRLSYGIDSQRQLFYPRNEHYNAILPEIEKVSNHLKRGDPKGRINGVISIGTLHWHITFRRRHRKMIQKDLNTELRPGSEYDGIWDRKRQRGWNSVQLCLVIIIQRLIQNGHRGLLVRHGYCNDLAFLLLVIQKNKQFLSYCGIRVSHRLFCWRCL